MQVIAIAAVADDGSIGSGEDMLWHIPEDFRRFKRVTMGHTLVFGRRTFEQIGRLPGRRHIVCTRDRSWSAQGVDVAHS
ncbi:MAG: dihydrofolate reductase, partial [Acidipropionibacterium jensenii]|nr:dihydrofolate reductase [Acidipropionibacterium jensenii]